MSGSNFRLVSSDDPGPEPMAPGGHFADRVDHPPSGPRQRDDPEPRWPSPESRMFLRIGRLPICVQDRAQAAGDLLEEARSRVCSGRRPFLATSANGQVVSACDQDPATLKMMESFDVISADGMPLVFASRLLCSVALPERVATTDLFHDAAARAEATGQSFFLLGADRSTMEQAALNVRRLYPGLRLLGAHHGYLDREQAADVCLAIARLRPDVLWIGMGFPREQSFTLEHLPLLRGVGAVKTTGGLFDFLAGRRSRAPSWMQDAGLEWAYRAALEPGRLGGRYLKTNPHALRVLISHTDREPLAAKPVSE